MGVGSRAEVKKMIRQGRVRVGDLIIKKPENKVNLNESSVWVDEQCIHYQKFEYYLLNKPAGVISATSDLQEKTVVDLIAQKRRKDLFPVGRLDKDTEGLLLITNDGELAHRLLSPKHHVDKCYYAKIDGTVTEEDKDIFKCGVNIGTELEPEITMPGILEILRSDTQSEIFLTIQEGKYHQVKRMFQSVGKKVIYLKRISMGKLVLDESLSPGDYRPLTDTELELLKEEL